MSGLANVRYASSRRCMESTAAVLVPFNLVSPAAAAFFGNGHLVVAIRFGIPFVAMNAWLGLWPKRGRASATFRCSSPFLARALPVASLDAQFG